MRELLNAARSMMSSQWEIANVRTRADDPSNYLAQVPGRGANMMARSNGLHVRGDEVLVTLRPNASIPGIVGASPWRTSSTAVATLTPVGPDPGVTVTTGGVGPETHPDGSPYELADFYGVASRIRYFWTHTAWNVVLDGGTR